MTTGAPWRVAGFSPARALLVTAWVALPVALAPLVALLVERPRALALVGGGVVVSAVAWRSLDRWGTLGLWAAALVLSLIAGEVAALSLGGQSGRLLWTDLVLALGLALVMLRQRGVIAAPMTPFLAVVACVCACGALSLLAAADPLTAMAELKEWLVMAAAGAAFVAWTGDVRRARLLLAWVALLGAAIALGMVLAAWRAPTGPLFAIVMKQVDLPWGRTNYLAGLLILALPVALGLAGASGRTLVRAAWGLVAVAVAAGLALSASKGAVMALGAALASIVWVRPQLPRGAVALALLLVAAGVLVFAVGPLQQVVAYRLQDSALAFSLEERRDLYALGWETFLAHPLTGVGLNNFSVLAHRLRGVDTVPHNLAIGWLAELGIAGGVLAIALVVTLLQMARRALARAVDPRSGALAAGVWVAVIGCVVHNQLESTIYGQQFKVVLAAVAAAAWRLSLPDPSKQSPGVREPSGWTPPARDARSRRSGLGGSCGG